MLTHLVAERDDAAHPSEPHPNGGLEHAGELFVDHVSMGFGQQKNADVRASPPRTSARRKFNQSSDAPYVMVPFQVSRRTSFVEPRFSVTVESKRLSERSCDERKPAFFLLRGVHRETRKEITVRIAQIAPLAEAFLFNDTGSTE